MEKSISGENSTGRKDGESPMDKFGNRLMMRSMTKNQPKSGQMIPRKDSASSNNSPLNNKKDVAGFNWTQMKNYATTKRFDEDKRTVVTDSNTHGNTCSGEDSFKINLKKSEMVHGKSEKVRGDSQNRNQSHKGNSRDYDIEKRINSNVIPVENIKKD